MKQQKQKRKRNVGENSENDIYKGRKDSNKLSKKQIVDELTKLGCDVPNAWKYKQKDFLFQQLKVWRDLQNCYVLVPEIIFPGMV